MEKKKHLLMFSGGYGKHIAATGVVRAFREAHKDDIVHVLASYPEWFAGLSQKIFADRVFGNSVPIPYFAEDHKDFIKHSAEPYLRSEFEQGKEHLIESYCRGFGVEPPAEIRGYMKVSDAEHESALRVLHQVDRSKTWVAFQPWGGTSYYSPEQGADLLRPKHVRDLPTEAAQKIVDGLVAKGCIVVQISLPSEKRLDKVIFLDPGQGKIVPPRVMVAILNLCQRFIGIDSFGQHAWVALGKPEKSGIALWGGTDPKGLGYSKNVNMVNEGSCDNLHCSRPYHLGDFVGRDTPWRCPIEEKCMAFDPEKVLAKFTENEPEKKPAPAEANKCP